MDSDMVYCCCIHDIYVAASCWIGWNICLSPVWTLMCLFRCSDRLNALSHKWHLYGFSPLWILLCLTRCWARVNRLLQTVHSNGFSPEWLRLCDARSRLVPQHLPHSVHLYLPLWIFIWLHRPLWDEKHFSHWVHEYKFSPVCFFLCWFNCPFVVNCSSHTVHKYGLDLSSDFFSITSDSLLQLSEHVMTNVTDKQ